MRHGFYGLVERVHLHLLIPLHRRIRKKRISEKKEILSLPERLRLAFEELGPTFIKLGQLMASRPDLVPEDISEECRKLLDKVPPFPAERVKALIEAELGAPVGEIFPFFEERPVAAASISQVHRANLPDGTCVMVKVQRPYIEKIINTDIELMFLMARLIDRYVPETRYYDPIGVVREFSRDIRKELDFVLEASNIMRIAKNFSRDKRIVIPDVYWDYTSPKVLTLSRIEGTRIDDIETLKQRGIDTARTARLLTDIFFAQIFKFGLFHGDLHAGNIFVVDEGRIGFVDFGIVGRISDDMMEKLANVFMGIVREDYKLLVESYLEMGVVSESVDVEGFKRDYRDLLEMYISKPLKEARLGALLINYARIAAAYKVKLPPELLLLSKCVLELEGLVRRLDPALDMLEAGEHYAEELFRIWLSPKRISKEIGEVAYDIDKTARVLPGQIRQLLKKMISDKFTIDFVHIGLENLIDEIDRSSNRLSLGIIISALIVGSSLIMLAGRGPLLMGFPVFGFIGFVIAGLLGFMLAVVIIRSRKF